MKSKAPRIENELDSESDSKSEFALKEINGQYQGQKVKKKTQLELKASKEDLQAKIEENVKLEPSSEIDDNVALYDQLSHETRQQLYSEDDDVPLAKKIKLEEKKKLKESDEEDEDYKWWLNHQMDDSGPKWKTLRHNGVLFPPEYVALPSFVKMKYDDEFISLPPEAEEVASFFGAMLETDHAKNLIFQKNFFEDFKEICERLGVTKIKQFVKCDFTPLYEYFEKQREFKKNMNKEEKLALKLKKEKEEALYKVCFLDDREEKVGNFRIEPPGLFRGRGNHPKTGKVKRRVLPEQITINIGPNEKIPEPPAGHKWADVRHDNTVTWLATWTENINNNVKYVFLAAGSSIKGQSDLKKYEKARMLKSHIDSIRSHYREDMKSDVMEIRQRGTALYLIDVFALRAGNEKGDDEADTVGCCSLRYEHVTLEPPNKVVFDFLGKDSIRYYNQVKVDHKAFKNLKIFKRAPKKEGDLIFDRLSTTKLNQHLSSIMSGLSAKVFRTYNASYTMARELKKATPKTGNIQEKILAYNRANRLVAILCNHQRSVSKSHGAQMEKFEDRIRAIKYQLRRVKLAMIQLDSSISKEVPQVLVEESDLEDEWMVSHEDYLLAKEHEKIIKKFERDKEKLKSENKEPLPDNVLQERLKLYRDLEAQINKERSYRKSGIQKVEIGSKSNLDKLKAKFFKLRDRLLASKTQKVDKDENKSTALGTSKINYIDPRITVAWCNKHMVPIEKMFTKTLRDKFQWAMEVDKSWTW